MADSDTNNATCLRTLLCLLHIMIGEITQENIGNITRFEVIDKTGHVVVRYNIAIEISIQGDGRTLKVFLLERKEKKDEQ